MLLAQRKIHTPKFRTAPLARRWPPRSKIRSKLQPSRRSPRSQQAAPPSTCSTDPCEVGPHESTRPIVRIPQIKSRHEAPRLQYSAAGEAAAAPREKTTSAIAMAPAASTTARESRSAPRTELPLSRPPAVPRSTPRTIPPRRPQQSVHAFALPPNSCCAPPAIRERNREISRQRNHR